MGLQAKITSKGQLTVPAEIREQLGLKPGDHVEFYIGLRGEIRLRPRNLPASSMLEVLEPRRASPKFKDDDAAIAAAIIERDGRSRVKKAAGK
jgi:antitoxin PrlF